MSQLPFPTVTICPKLPFDRFAAISALLDQVHSHKAMKGDALIHIYFYRLSFPADPLMSAAQERSTSERGSVLLWTSLGRTSWSSWNS